MTNYGTGPITTATIGWNLDGGTNTVINFAGNLAQGQSGVFNLGPMTVSIGSHDINAVLTDVNGITDDNTTNDNATDTVDVIDQSLDIVDECEFIG